MSEHQHSADKDQHKREILMTARSSSPGHHHDPPVQPEDHHKRRKRPYLQFSGARHTRVGDDYQVTTLPPYAAHHFQPKPAVPVEPEDEPASSSSPNNNINKVSTTAVMEPSSSSTTNEQDNKPDNE